MVNTPLLSVVIATRNESTNIRTILESIRKQTYQRIEVIVVDNASTDSTKETAKKMGAQVFEKGPERSAQRNFGASKARGNYLLFLDADMILTTVVVKECVKEFKNNIYQKALVIPEKSIGIGFWAACKALERSLYVGVDWLEAARCYRKDTFIELGGYDEKLTGPEDVDLPQRLKARFGNNSVGRIRGYIIHNEGHLSLERSLQKKYYYARYFPAYSKKIVNAEYARKQSNVALRYWVLIRNPKKLFEHPAIGLGMLFLKSAEFIAGAFGSAKR